jgi:glycoside hydrolase-like protein
VTTFGIDYAWGGPPGIPALRNASVQFVCRYLSHSPSKNLTASEARTLSDAGIWIVVVWETTANRALSGYSGGAADAQDALSQAEACGMPAGRPIYFAVDWDAGAGQQTAINAYLDGAASVLGPERVGIYGGYGPVERALDGGHAAWAWQTYAWSGGQWDPRAHIQQYSNDHTIAGVGCDYDRAMKPDFGQWRVGAAPNTQEDDMAELVSLGVDGKQKISANSVGTILFTKAYSDKHNLWHEDKDGTSYSIIVDSTLWAIANGIFELHGLDAGASVDVAWSRMTPPAKSGDVWQLGDDAWRLPYTANKDGAVRAEIGGQFGLDPSVRLRLRVYNSTNREITVQGCMVKVSLFKY